MPTPTVRLESRLGTSGGGYWTSSTWTTSDFTRVSGSADDLDYDLAILMFVILKQDFTGVDPLAVNLNSSEYVEFLVQGPIREDGWTFPPSYIAQRAYYAYHERGAPHHNLGGSFSSNFIKGHLILFKNVVQQPPADVAGFLMSQNNVNTPISITSTVSGIAAHVVGNDPGLFQPYVGAPPDDPSRMVEPGETFTSTVSNGLREFHLLLTLEKTFTGWVVGSVGW